MREIKEIIKKIANELLNSKANNGFGIHCGTFMELSKKHNVNPYDVFKEIVRIAKEESED